MSSHPILLPTVTACLRGALEKVRREELDRYRNKLTPDKAMGRANSARPDPYNDNTARPERTVVIQITGRAYVTRRVLCQ